MSKEIKYYKLEKPSGAPKDWEVRLIFLCKKLKVNYEIEKLAKGKKVYSLSCPKDDFDILVREMRRFENESKGKI